MGLSLILAPTTILINQIILDDGLTALELGHLNQHVKVISYEMQPKKSISLHHIFHLSFQKILLHINVCCTSMYMSYTVNDLLDLHWDVVFYSKKKKNPQVRRKDWFLFQTCQTYTGFHFKYGTEHHWLLLKSFKKIPAWSDRLQAMLLVSPKKWTNTLQKLQYTEMLLSIFLCICFI